MATKLETIATAQRKVHLARNEYNHEDLYGSGNLNALANGDEKGKGEYEGQVGSLTDQYQNK